MALLAFQFEDLERQGAVSMSTMSKDIVSTVVPSWQISLEGSALIGVGCSNILPVLLAWPVAKKRRRRLSLCRR
jgi:hypothetical protein